jgi:hypothetical protein
MSSPIGLTQAAIAHLRAQETLAPPFHPCTSPTADNDVGVERIEFH